jgi:hypothetical protein
LNVRLLTALLLNDIGGTGSPKQRVRIFGKQARHKRDEGWSSGFDRLARIAG